MSDNDDNPDARDGPARNGARGPSVERRVNALINPAVKKTCMGDPDRAHAAAQASLDRQYPALMRLIPSGVPNAEQMVDSILSTSTVYIDQIYAERSSRAAQVDRMFDGIVFEGGRRPSIGVLQAR